jgi:exodeoxyribonuclease-3
MKMISWNVNGIRSVIRKGFSEWLEREDPDVLCLQETRARPSQLEGIIDLPQGYRSFWNWPSRKGYAGVSVFTKIPPRDVSKDIGAEGFDDEGRSLCLDLGSFFLVNVYFPNGRSGSRRLKYKLEFYERFLDFIGTLKGKDTVICGDVNTAHRAVDLARPESNRYTSGFLPEEREWIDRFLDTGFVDSFRAFNQEAGYYTWWDLRTRSRERNVGWRIDYFFVSESMKGRLKKAFIMSEVQGSDHCPIGIELKGGAG